MTNVCLAVFLFHFLIVSSRSQNVFNHSNSSNNNDNNNDNNNSATITPSFYESLKLCNLSTHQLCQLGTDDKLEPCIVAHVKPDINESHAVEAIATVVQVTPSNCCNHRDGVVTGIELLNQNNGGRGTNIGFNKDHQVHFQLISIVAGNPSNLGSDQYLAQHAALLDSVLSTNTLSVQYIVGSCSFASSVEKAIALKHKTILMAQVGPPGYYTDQNPYVFGFHLNSETYPVPALRTLSFDLDARNIPHNQQNVKVLYRTKSEFFYSTCRSAIYYAKELGFNLTEIEYDPDEDHNGDGKTNAYDEEFLVDLADQVCPPGSDSSDKRPAIFGCVLIEQDVLIQRWRENGCIPNVIWMTPSTWGWADRNADVVPFFQGGGQWHEVFDYSDDFFQSGKQLLEFNLQKFGYMGAYDMVVGYSIAILFAQHLVSSYRISDFPLVAEDFTSETGYEKLRRDMLVLNANTLFGPFSLNEYQRNVGRGAAGTQWQPKGHSNASLGYENKCISPFTQAEAATIVPASAALHCPAGSFISYNLIQNSSSLLENKCQICPINTYSIGSNIELQCDPCPSGSSTLGEIGATACTSYKADLLPTGIKVMGLFFVGITWVLAILSIVWLRMKRDDPVVKISQMPFMLLICIGAIISSSSIVALTLAEADDGEDTTSANFACQSIPFLYTIGWALQYSSLFAKSYRIYKLTNVQRFQRVTITTKAMMKLIAIFMLADLTVVFIWTFVDPLTYEREIIGRNVDSENGLITVSTVGRCTNGPPTDFWPYIGPLAFFHILLMVVTNFLLWMTRKIVDDRYQEQKYVALASLYVGEILLVGLPVLLAVGESVVAQYIVLSCLVFLNDSGILAFVFFPKMNFVKEGLPEGVSVTQSVQRSTLNSSIKFNMQGSFTEGRISTHSVTATNPQDESHPEITLPTHHEDEENSAEISSSTKQRSKQGRLG